MKTGNFVNYGQIFWQTVLNANFFPYLQMEQNFMNASIWQYFSRDLMLYIYLKIFKALFIKTYIRGQKGLETQDFDLQGPRYLQGLDLGFWYLYNFFPRPKIRVSQGLTVIIICPCPMSEWIVSMLFLYL